MFVNYVFIFIFVNVMLILKEFGSSKPPVPESTNPNILIFSIALTNLLT